MKKFIIFIFIVFFSLNFNYVWAKNNSKENIENKIEKQISKFDKLPKKEKEKIYNQLLKNIDNSLKNENISKKNKVLIKLFKDVIIKKKK